MSNQSVSNARMTFDEIMERFNTEVKPAVPASRSTSRSRTTSGVDSAALERRLMQAMLPSIPPMVGKLSQGDIKKKMQPALDSKRVIAIGALPRDELDPRAVSKKQRQLANFTTNEMTFAHFGKDGAVFSLAKALTKDSFGEGEDFEMFVEALEQSTLSIGSSGTAAGLYNRLVTGITAAPRPSLAVTDYVRYARSVLEYGEVDLDFVGQSLAEMIKVVKHSKDFLFNWKSSAGIPYYKKVGDAGVLPEGVALGTQLLNAFADAKVKVLAAERPSLFAVMLKNKQDIYELAKLDKKVRPYFVYPLHERLLYSVLQCRLKARRFDETIPGSSAVGFSWNYGGGDKMYKWIKGRVDSGPGFYSIFYGDDQLWVIVLADGSAYICTPDFSHMDLSLAPVWGQVAYSMWRKAYTKLDKTWESVLKYNCSRAFTRPVVVDGALTYLFQYGLGSGIPGTTKFDEVASAAVNGYVKEQFDLVKDRISNKMLLEKWLDAVAKVVKTKFGLIFKDGSMDAYPFEADQESYPWVFLGQTLVKVRGRDRYHYIPKPDLAKIVLSATTYKKAHTSVNNKQKSKASKLRSLFAGGGYLYPAFASVLERDFDSLARQGITPFLEGEEDGFELETESNMLFSVEFIGEHWPTEEWVLNLYLPPDDQVEDHTGISISDRLRPATGNELAEFTVDLAGFSTTDSDSDREQLAPGLDAALMAALDPKDWVQQERVERSSADKGDEPPPKPPSVPTKNQAELQPLPESVKLAFEKEQQEAREKIRAERPVPSGPSKKGGKAARKPTGRDTGKRSGAAIQEGDFDYQDEPESDFPEFS